MARSLEQIIGRTRRGDRRLRPWLRNNYDVILPLVGDGRADWTPVVAVLREVGVEDARGQTPSRETLAKAWRAVSAQRERQRASTVAARAPSIAPGVRSLAPNESFSAATAHGGRPRIRTAPADGPVPSTSRRSREIREPADSRTVEEGTLDPIQRALDRV